MKVLQPIDKIAIALITILGLIMGLLVWGGYACGDNCLFYNGARVSQFSWQNKFVGKEDQAFLLTFNRPMDRASVEENLAIEPPLPGKISWSGLTLAYTLETPAPYGESYQVTLNNARDRFATEDGEVMPQFVGNFRSRDRAFAYIGSQGEENGRLVLYNWTQQQKTIVTPDNLIVFEFEPYPQSDRLLFSAASRDSGIDSIRTLQLYTVTTGLNDPNLKNFRPQLKLVLDNQQYQNNKFNLSQDGKTIVVQRVDRQQPSKFGLWAIAKNRPPQLISDSPGGDFLLTPDSQTVAVAQGEGIALLPLQPDADPLDFLPQFGQVLSFAPNGSGAAMINYNTDNANLSYTRSLFYVNNQGKQTELLNIEGSILDCQFHPSATKLYCWLTEVEKTKEYQEKPYLASIEIPTGKTTPILTLPEYQDVQISIAPDGLGILFDRVLTGQVTPTINTPTTNSGETIVNSHIWMLIPSPYQLEQLPFIGFHPQWLP
ncbi:MAG: Ig-like domain-containing protein [Pleurocapsa sp.]